MQLVRRFAAPGRKLFRRRARCPDLGGKLLVELFETIARVFELAEPLAGFLELFDQLRVRRAAVTLLQTPERREPAFEPIILFRGEVETVKKIVDGLGGIPQGKGRVLDGFRHVRELFAVPRGALGLRSRALREGNGVLLAVVERVVGGAQGLGELFGVAQKLPAG